MKDQLIRWLSNKKIMTLNDQAAIKVSPNWLAILDHHRDLETSKDLVLLPGGIDRKAIIQNFDVITNEYIARDLFTASMIWGFGHTGYGQWRLNQMLKSAKATKFSFLRTANLLANGNLEGAVSYLIAARPAYCGPAFYTKYLYFLSRCLQTKQTALILDSVVVKSLDDILGGKAGSSGFGYQNYAPKPNMKKYIEYVELMKEVAIAKNVSPDQIEMTLFMESRPYWGKVKKCV